jgi:group I intron endonuclease
MIGIYKITNPEGQVYIGQTTNLRSRYFSHKNPVPCNSKLYSSFDFYGFDNHEFTFIYECEIKDLNRCEQYFIEKYNPSLNSNFTKEKHLLITEPKEFEKKLVREGNYIFNLYLIDNGKKVLLENTKDQVNKFITKLQNDALDKCVGEVLKNK